MIRSVGVMDRSMISSVYTRDAPWERASVRRAVVDARTMGARISELRKRWLAASWGDSWERSMVVVVEEEEDDSWGGGFWREWDVCESCNRSIGDSLVGDEFASMLALTILGRFSKGSVQRDRGPYL